MQAGPPEWGGEQGWLELASKLPFCYVIYPSKGDILHKTSSYHQQPIAPV